MKRIILGLLMVGMNAPVVAMSQYMPVVVGATSLGAIGALCVYGEHYMTNPKSQALRLLNSVSPRVLYDLKIEEITQPYEYQKTSAIQHGFFRDRVLLLREECEKLLETDYEFTIESEYWRWVKALDVYRRELCEMTRDKTLVQKSYEDIQNLASYKNLRNAIEALRAEINKKQVAKPALSEYTKSAAKWSMIPTVVGGALYGVYRFFMG